VVGVRALLGDSVPAVACAGVIASSPAVFDVPAPARLTPLAPRRLALRVTVDEEMEALLREAHEPLGHPTATSHVADVLMAALELYVERLRKQKFGATDAPRPGRERSPESRHIPLEVQRAVWERDAGRCTFVSQSGRRCEERSGVQFDHTVPYARGGSSTISNIRLLCPAHNQLEAECAFGAEFMKNKRRAAAG